LAFWSVVVPEPFWVKPPLPANGLEIVKLVDAATTKPLLAVRILVVPERFPPANVKVENVGLMLLKFRVPPLLSSNELLVLPKAVALPRVKVPAETILVTPAPPKVLAALSVKFPAPLLLFKPPVPAKTYPFAMSTVLVNV